MMSKTQTQIYLKIARDVVSDFSKVVTSADAFYESLRDTPYYVTRSVARTVWNAYGRHTGWEDYRLRRDPNAPLLTRFFEYDEYGISAPYMAKYELEGVDPETGKTWHTRPAAFFDHIPTQAELDQQEQVMIEKYTPEGMDMLTTTARITALLGDTERIRIGQ